MFKRTMYAEQQPKLLKSTEGTFELAEHNDNLITFFADNGKNHVLEVIAYPSVYKNFLKAALNPYAPVRTSRLEFDVNNNKQKLYHGAYAVDVRVLKP